MFQGIMFQKVVHFRTFSDGTLKQKISKAKNND